MASSGPDLPLYPEPLVAEGKVQGISFSASVIERAPHQCPAYTSINIHRGVYAATGRWRKRWPEPVGFFQGALFDILTNVEDGMNLDKAIDNTVAEAAQEGEPVHPFVVAYMYAAAESYLQFSTARAHELKLHSAEPRTLTSRRRPVRTLTAWGRWYESADGLYREFRRLRYGAAKPVDDDHLRFAAAAAKLLVDGKTDEALPAALLPERVAVIEVGMLDGSTTMLFDGNPDEARAAYNERCYPITKELTEDPLELRPGRECSQCKWRVVCPAVLQLRGVLGLPGQAVSTRDISASDLVQYSICPASYVARVGHLPATAEASPSFAAERGRSVHRWLRIAHARGIRCSGDDLPVPEDGVGDPLAALDEQEYVDAWPYLIGHVEHCPLGDPTVTDVHIEPTIRAWDADADVMVIATPDLTWMLPAGVPVWRETKTVPKLLPQDPLTLLRKWPQVALYLVMLAEGGGRGEVVEPGVHVGIVEVEMLTDASTPPIVQFFTEDDWMVTQARRVVAEKAYPWSQDTMFDTKPGNYCQNCSALRWCDDAEAAAGDAPEIDTEDPELFVPVEDSFD